LIGEEPAVKQTLWRAAKWLAGIGLLAGIIWFNWDSFSAIAQKWDQFEPSYLILAGAIFLADCVLTFLRWYLLVRAQNLPFRVIDAIRLGFIGLFTSAFLPGSITGDVVKAALLAREQSRRAVAIATILVDRVIGLYGLLVLASLAGLVYWDQVNTTLDAQGRAPLRVLVTFTWAVTLGVLAAAIVLALVFTLVRGWRERLGSIPWVGSILVKLVEAGALYKSKIGVLLMATLLAVVGHLGFVICFYLAAQAIPPPVPTLEQHLMLVPVGLIVESVPLTPGNLGVGELTYQSLYALVDSTGEFKDNGAAAKLAHRLVNWVVALIGLGFYLPLRGTVRQIIKEQEATPAEAQP
jgi:hypothetical protein